MLDTLFLGLSVGAWITIATMIGVFLTLLFTNTKPYVAFFCAIAVLNVSGVMSVEEAFHGFNTGSIVTIGLLYITISALRHTGALEWIVSHLMGQPKTHTAAILRMMLPVGLLSSFMSNTATTALFQGVVRRWAERLNISPSKLLIPLAYAASLGGLLTLLGTPPNLIIAGLYASKTGVHLNILAPLPIGLCCLLVSILVVIIMRHALPTRQAEVQTDDDDEVSLTSSQATWRTYFSLGMMAAILILSAANVLSLSSCCILAGVILVITGCCTSEQASKEVDWNVLIVFAGSICIGTAIQKTGIDTFILNQILGSCGHNPIVVLTTICVVAAIMTEFMSDTACAAMFFPIAWSAAQTLDMNPAPVMVALMIAVSNSYATPIATPPNTLVYTSGGYRFADFARIGVVLKIVNLAIAISMTMFLF